MRSSRPARCHRNEAIDYCRACGGVSQAPARRLRQYLLAKAQDSTRLAQFAEHEEVKSLRDEIALARMLIERRFNLIQNDADLISACGSLNTLLLTVGRLMLFESTQLDDLPCEITGEVFWGTQAHQLEHVVNIYKGKVWHYPLYRALYPDEDSRLTEFLMGTLHTPYDNPSHGRQTALSWP